MSQNHDILSEHYGFSPEPVVHQGQAFLKPVATRSAGPFSGPLSDFLTEMVQSPTPPTAEQWQTLKQAVLDAETGPGDCTGA